MKILVLGTWTFIHRTQLAAQRPRCARCSLSGGYSATPYRAVSLGNHGGRASRCRLGVLSKLPLSDHILFEEALYYTCIHCSQAQRRDSSVALLLTTTITIFLLKKICFYSTRELFC